MDVAWYFWENLDRAKPLILIYYCNKGSVECGGLNFISHDVDFQCKRRLSTAAMQSNKSTSTFSNIAFDSLMSLFRSSNLTIMILAGMFVSHLFKLIESLHASCTYISLIANHSDPIVGLFFTVIWSTVWSKTTFAFHFMISTLTKEYASTRWTQIYCLRP